MDMGFKGRLKSFGRSTLGSRKEMSRLLQSAALKLSPNRAWRLFKNKHVWRLLNPPRELLRLLAVARLWIDWFTLAQGSALLTSNSSPDAVQEKTTTMLASLHIRRDAGVLATQNRIRPQLARRIVTFLTSPDHLDEGAS
ncbi:unnamed protein product [Schistocephalus solidus]|uniref:Transposase n=1 Tax=Schistocephalus solidus TaxID=70667 RepID=A0A183SKW6_SCHSO|nr:unnamed protein product [Schistocephalus solidus]